MRRGFGGVGGSEGGGWIGCLVIACSALRATTNIKHSENSILAARSLDS